MWEVKTEMKDKREKQQSSLEKEAKGRGYDGKCFIFGVVCGIELITRKTSLLMCGHHNHSHKAGASEHSSKANK